MKTILVIVSFISASAAFRYFEAEELKRCPNVLPVEDYDLKKLQGSWRLSTLILDAATEHLEESTVCVTGQILVQNSTFMKQSWDMYTPSNPKEPVGNIEFAINVIRPGVWTVQTPLGAQLSAKLFGYGENYVLVTHCGWHKGNLVHLWTAGVTRNKNSLTPEMRIKISHTLLDNGFHPETTKIITWNEAC